MVRPFAEFIAYRGWVAILLFALLYSTFSHLIASIQQAVRVAEATARGDLTQPIHAQGTNEVARLLQSLPLQQRRVVVLERLVLLL